MQGAGTNISGVFAFLKSLLLSQEEGPKGVNTVCALTADIPGTIGKKRHPLIFLYFFYFSLFLSAHQPVSQLDANPQQQQQHK